MFLQTHPKWSILSNKGRRELKFTFRDRRKIICHLVIYRCYSICSTVHLHLFTYLQLFTDEITITSMYLRVPLKLPAVLKNESCNEILIYNFNRLILFVPGDRRRWRRTYDRKTPCQRPCEVGPASFPRQTNGEELLGWVGRTPGRRATRQKVNVIV